VGTIDEQTTSRSPIPRQEQRPGADGLGPGVRPGAAETGRHWREPGRTAPVTAEIPAVPERPGYGVLLSDGTVWYPGSKRRLPAPVPLRVLNWLLFFLLVLAGAGLAAERLHPQWFSVLRNSVGASSPTSFGAAAPTAGAHRADHRPAGLRLLSVSPAGSSYAVELGSSSSYELAFSTTAPCWVDVESLPAGNALFAETLPGRHLQYLPVSGPVSVEFGATGTTLAVEVGGRYLGSITSPELVPYLYTLRPETS
jgi:hypothetical protein